MFPRCIVRTEILPTFLMYELKTKIHSKTPFKPMGRKPPDTSHSPYRLWTPSNSLISRPTSLTTPNDSSIGSRTSAKLRNKFLIGYNKMLHIYLQKLTAPSLRRSPPPSTPIPRPTSLAIQAASRSNPQYTIQTDRETDRPTDRWTRRQVCTNY